MNKIDIDRLKAVPVDLINLSEVAKIEVVKKSCVW